MFYQVLSKFSEVTYTCLNIYVMVKKKKKVKIKECISKEPTIKTKAHPEIRIARIRRENSLNLFKSIPIPKP